MLPISLKSGYISGIPLPMGCLASVQPGIPESADFFKKYALGKKIGEGAFGQVRLATHINTKAVFAVKIADVRERAVNGKAAVVVSSRRQGSVEREIRAWQMASTGSIPEITHLLEPFYSSGFYYMVCELCNKNLMQHLLHVKTISEEELGDLTAQMLRAIGHVHKVGLVHRVPWQGLDTAYSTAPKTISCNVSYIDFVVLSLQP